MLTQKRIKCQEINVVKEMVNLYFGNYKKRY